jgi:hypothetical protein
MRFHFKVHRGEQYPDRIDGAFASIGEARTEAARLLCRLINDQRVDLWSGDDVRVVIQDADELTLCQVHAFASISPLGRQLTEPTE